MLTYQMHSCKQNGQKLPFNKQFLTRLIEMFGASPKHCGLFTLVDSLLKQQNKARSKKIVTLKVAESILVSMPQINLKISSPSATPPESFLVNMLNIAECLKTDTGSHHPLIKLHGEILIASYQDLLKFLNIEIPESDISDFIGEWDQLLAAFSGNTDFIEFYKKFETCWHNFTAVYLLEYIYKQMNLNINRLSEKLEELCPKLIIETEELLLHY